MKWRRPDIICQILTFSFLYQTYRVYQYDRFHSDRGNEKNMTGFWHSTPTIATWRQRHESNQVNRNKNRWLCTEYTEIPTIIRIKSSHGSMGSSTSFSRTLLHPKKAQGQGITGRKLSLSCHRQNEIPWTIMSEASSSGGSTSGSTIARTRWSGICSLLWRYIVTISEIKGNFVI